MAIGVSERRRVPGIGQGGRRGGVSPTHCECRAGRFVGTLLVQHAPASVVFTFHVHFHVKRSIRLRQGRDEDLGQLAALVVLPDILTLFGHLDEVDVLVVVGPRGEGAVHRGLEVAALDERHEPEVLVELVYQRVAQLRVPLPRDPAPEPGPVRSILGLGPEVAQLLLNVGGVCVVQPVELPCDVVDLAAVARLREGHPARDAHSQWQHCRWRPTHFP
mmetsp:Transcript_20037/g.50684  ORF Transcript_20037/g.50684 Transcript_20037/m.50684 type:complete len:218 (-) Transcript_20037:27-680(-)